jgi:hypothetical protein
VESSENERRLLAQLSTVFLIEVLLNRIARSECCSPTRSTEIPEFRGKAEREGSSRALFPIGAGRPLTQPLRCTRLRPAGRVARTIPTAHFRPWRGGNFNSYSQRETAKKLARIIWRRIGWFNSAGERGKSGCACPAYGASHACWSGKTEALRAP